jgi:hypothetical protein
MPLRTANMQSSVIGHTPMIISASRGSGHWKDQVQLNLWLLSLLK